MPLQNGILKLTVGNNCIKGVPGISLPPFCLGGGGEILCESRQVQNISKIPKIASCYEQETPKQ